MDTVIKNKDQKSWLKILRKPSKQMFWAWIAYQTVKGTLTTSLIWVPLFWTMFH